LQHISLDVKKTKWCHFLSCRINRKAELQLQRVMMMADLPFMISGARYSWVPTKDIERASVGSAKSSGRGVTCHQFHLQRLERTKQAARMHNKIQNQSSIIHSFS
jgi:hypothetical protein